MSGEDRYFCHQCSVYIPQVTDEFSCPVCHSGFVEVQNGEEQGGREPAEPDPMDQQDFPGPLSALLPSLLGAAGGLDMQLGVDGRPGRYHIYRQGPLRPLGRGGGAGPGAQDRHLENFLQDLIFNVTGMGVAGGGGGQLGVGPQGLQLHLVPGNQIHGNPGDYAWGRGGLDAIITQLLNQVEGAGPPPMAQENIKELPSVDVDAGILEKNPNCSVCWEDFTVDESVKQLECMHCFHKDCIVPWLELHGTCPVCRKVLNGEGEVVEGSDQEADHAHPTGQENYSSGSGAASGGITGFLQNAFSSILDGTLNSQSGLGLGSRDTYTSQVSHPSSSSAPSTQQTSSVSTTPAAGTTSSASTTATNQSGVRGNRADPSAAEDETPASRRQRLNSDFVDFDLE